MAYRPDSFSGGFAEPVFESQATFRTLMDAMARPGTLAEITAATGAPAPMAAASAAIALTVCDHDTPVCLSPAMIEAGVQSWLAFHTGALVAEDRNDAAFAFFEAGAPLPPLSTFAAGTQDYPDRSTTIVLGLPALESGDVFILSGPGIDGETEITPAGLPPHFDRMWAENHALYPRGVDLVLTSGSRILCLPRTTRLARKES